MRIKDITKNIQISEGPIWDRLNKLVQDLAVPPKLKARLEQEVNLMNDNQLRNYVERGIDEKKASFAEIYKYTYARSLVKDTKTISESKKKETKYVYRIDSKKITNFGKNLKKYRHTPDWGMSQVKSKNNDNWWNKQDLNYETSQGLFAGSLKHVAPYATGNAGQTCFITYKDNGKDYVVFDQRQREEYKNRQTYLSVFDAKDFQETASNEYFSANPGKPIEQIPINDPFEFIRKQDLHIRFVPNINEFFNKYKNKLRFTGWEGL